MRAVHWLRSRQEERELIYWLSFVAYDTRDRSLNNRIYLLYLIVFFSIWVFMALTLFASGGAKVLLALNPQAPARAAAFLAVLVLGVWSVSALWRSLWRSPVVFSEEDAVLLCQTPVNRRSVVLRWLWMPWLESAIPFWLIAVILGFSLAEVAMSGTIGFDRLFDYAGYGLRAWLAVIPAQLALFVLVWIAGVYRLRQEIDRRGLPTAILLANGALVLLLLFSTLSPNVPMALQVIAGMVAFPIWAGFGAANLSTAVLSFGLLSLVLLSALVWISAEFSLSRAAQETQVAYAISSANRFGFASEARRLKEQERLGMQQRSTRLPSMQGAGALVWKDLVQSWRLFRLPVLFDWLLLFGFIVILPLLNSLGAQLLMIALWALQVGKVCAARVRGDLALWPITRQLPISSARVLLADLSLPYLLVVLLSAVGLWLSAFLFRQGFNALLLLVPGIAAAVAGMTAFDVIRRSRSSLLLNGTVPGVGASGALLSLVCAAAVLLVYLLLPGIVGLLASVLASLVLAWLSFRLAVRSYKDRE